MIKNKIKTINLLIYAIFLMLPSITRAEIISVPKSGFTLHKDYYFFEESNSFKAAFTESECEIEQVQEEVVGYYLLDSSLEGSENGWTKVEGPPALEGSWYSAAKTTAGEWVLIPGTIWEDLESYTYHYSNGNYKQDEYGHRKLFYTPTKKLVKNNTGTGEKYIWADISNPVKVDLLYFGADVANGRCETGSTCGIWTTRTITVNKRNCSNVENRSVFAVSGGVYTSENYTYFRATNDNHIKDESGVVCLTNTLNGITFTTSTEKCAETWTATDYYKVKQEINKTEKQTICINDNVIGRETYRKGLKYTYWSPQSNGNIEETYYIHYGWANKTNSGTYVGTNSFYNKGDETCQIKPNALGNYVADSTKCENFEYARATSCPLENLTNTSTSTNPKNSTEDVSESVSKAVITGVDITTDTFNKMVVKRTLYESEYISQHGNDLTTKLEPALYVDTHTETCKEIPTNPSLTCSTPEKIFTSGDGCNLYITESSGDNTAVISINQKGILKVKLNNTYIKSGESFTFGITFEDTITWNAVSGTLDSDMVNQLKDKRIKDAELFNKLNSTIIYEYERSHPEKGYTLNGTWKYYVYNYTTNSWENLDAITSANRVADVLFNNPSSGTGEAKIKIEYELFDAYTNPNEYGEIIIGGNTLEYDGVKHAYTNDPSTLLNSEDWILEGKRFYTRLDTTSSYVPIHAEINGLSAVKYDYDGGNEYFWSATYDCGITCNQEYYGNSNLLNSDDGGYNYSYREIDNKNPFPIVSGQVIGLDQNWITWATAVGQELQEEEPGEESITNRGLNKIRERLSATYSTEPQYVVTIGTETDPVETALRNIKNYNINNNYFENSGYVNDRLSKFIQNPPQGVNITRRLDLVANEVGYCGENRGETISDGTCFCMLTDDNGKCVYNRNFTWDW